MNLFVHALRSAYLRTVPASVVGSLLGLKLRLERSVLGKNVYSPPCLSTARPLLFKFFPSPCLLLLQQAGPSLIQKGRIACRCSCIVVAVKVNSGWHLRWRGLLPLEILLTCLARWPSYFNIWWSQLIDLDWICPKFRRIVARSLPLLISMPRNPYFRFSFVGRIMM